MGEDGEIKVVDKRFSASRDEEEKKSPEEEKPKETRGDGFVVKDVPEQKAQTPVEVDFSTFVFSLATGALINLGLSPDPISKKIQKNVELAKQNIDILALLQEKTKGNLTPDEDKLLVNLLTEIRLRFVDATR